MKEVMFTNIGLIALIGFCIYLTNTYWPLVALGFLQSQKEGA